MSLRLKERVDAAGEQPRRVVLRTPPCGRGRFVGQVAEGKVLDNGQHVGRPKIVGHPARVGDNPKVIGYRTASIYCRFLVLHTLLRPELCHCPITRRRILKRKICSSSGDFCERRSHVETTHRESGFPSLAGHDQQDAQTASKIIESNRPGGSIIRHEQNALYHSENRRGLSPA